MSAELAKLRPVGLQKSNVTEQVHFWMQFYLYNLLAKAFVAWIGTRIIQNSHLL